MKAQIDLANSKDQIKPREGAHPLEFCESQMLNKTYFHIERGPKKEGTPMKVLDLAYVCYAVSDLKKAKSFYETAFILTCTNSWTSSDGDSGFLEFDIGSSTLALSRGNDQFALDKARNVTAALEVEDFEAALKHLKTSGVTFIKEPYETPVCRMALVADLDGNPIVIHKRKPV
jgi:predicted enzyme related to lactoylglutathione lyase